MTSHSNMNHLMLTPPKSPDKQKEAEFEINIKEIGNYVLKSELGSGAFGKVFSARHKQTNELVAIKILDKIVLSQTPEDYELVQQELNILKIVRHKNIVQLYEIIETDLHIFIVMEYCDGKDFMDYILRKRRLSELESLKFFQELINSLFYLHSQNIAHRDIKIDNMLLDKNKNLKIVDFGLSTKYTDDDLLSQPCGTVVYAAPEVLEGKEYHGMLADVWSSGIVLFGMLSGYLPFSDADDEENKKNVIHGTIDMPDYFSEPCKDLLHHMLDKDPMTRYTLQDIKEHAWFKKKECIIFPGIIIGENRIPIDNEILNMAKKYNVDKVKLKNDLLKNKINSNTALYYLLIRHQKNFGYESVSDLSTKKFVEFILNEDNWINDNTETKKTSLTPKKRKTKNEPKNVDSFVQSVTKENTKATSESFHNNKAYNNQKKDYSSYEANYKVDKNIKPYKKERKHTLPENSNKKKVVVKPRLAASVEKIRLPTNEEKLKPKLQNKNNIPYQRDITINKENNFNNTITNSNEITKIKNFGIKDKKIKEKIKENIEKSKNNTKEDAIKEKMEKKRDKQQKDKRKINFSLIKEKVKEIKKERIANTPGKQNQIFNNQNQLDQTTKKEQINKIPKPRPTHKKNYHSLDLNVLQNNLFEPNNKIQLNPKPKISKKKNIKPLPIPVKKENSNDNYIKIMNGNNEDKIIHRNVDILSIDKSVQFDTPRQNIIDISLASNLQKETESERPSDISKRRDEIKEKAHIDIKTDRRYVRTSDKLSKQKHKKINLPQELFQTSKHSPKNVHSSLNTERRKAKSNLRKFSYSPNNGNLSKSKKKTKREIENYEYFEKLYKQSINFTKPSKNHSKKKQLIRTNNFLNNKIFKKANKKPGKTKQNRNISLPLLNRTLEREQKNKNLTISSYDNFYKFNLSTKRNKSIETINDIDSNRPNKPNKIVYYPLMNQRDPLFSCSMNMTLQNTTSNGMTVPLYEGPIDFNCICKDNKTLDDLVAEVRTKLNSNNIIFIQIKNNRFKCTKNGTNFDLEIVNIPFDDFQYLFYYKFCCRQGTLNYFKHLINYIID